MSQSPSPRPRSSLEEKQFTSPRRHTDSLPYHTTTTFYPRHPKLRRLYHRTSALVNPLLRRLYENPPLPSPYQLRLVCSLLLAVLTLVMVWFVVRPTQRQREEGFVPVRLVSRWGARKNPGEVGVLWAATQRQAVEFVE